MNHLKYFASAPRGRHPRFVGPLVLALLGMTHVSLAGSSTWDLNPTSNDWNTPANWTPETVPDESTDVATFDVSNVTNVSVSPGVAIGGIAFSSDARTYAIVGDFSIGGVGIINNSGVTQNFVSSP